jgi:hypothetical protein
MGIFRGGGKLLMAGHRATFGLVVILLALAAVFWLFYT